MVLQNRKFETEVKLGDILTLEALNKAFSAYLETIYHKTLHSEIKQEPSKFFREKENVKRSVEMSHVIKFFLHQEKRCVHRDFSNISLDGKFYKVNPKFRGDKVIVRFDPFSAMKQLFLYSMESQYLGIAELYDRHSKLNKPFLYQAAQKTERMTLSHMLLALQQL